jgi:hypothetical protein
MCGLELRSSASAHPRVATRRDGTFSLVMAGLGQAWPGHPRLRRGTQTWMRGTSPRMTVVAAARQRNSLYDLVIEIDHNTRPRKARRGSAVFVHIARPQSSPTAGCVALRVADLRRLLARVGPNTRLTIEV